MRVVAALAALVALALPATAGADTLGLSFIPPQPVAASPNTIAIATQSATGGSVFLVAHQFGTSCAPTAAADTAVPGSEPIPGVAVGAGALTSYASWFPNAAVPYWLCGYLAKDSASAPAAAAVVPVIVSPIPQVAPPFPGYIPPLEPQAIGDEPTDVVPRTPRTPKNTADRIFSRLHSHTFGTHPLPISIGGAHAPANGDSGGATVSGDNRKARLAAFHSTATNLVGGDSNGHSDVFVWQRPRGALGLILNRLGGSVQRASISSSGKQANGDSSSPSLDGSITSVPHCVAFESTATNLAPGDGDRTSDIYVRDLRTRHTYLVSRGVAPAATHPSIDGHCSQVAFQAGSGVYLGSAHGGRAHRISGGSQPDYSLDGSAIVWKNGGSVFIRRRGVTTKVGPGSNPHVSDEESGIWGIVFDSGSRLKKGDRDSKTDVYTRVVKRHGGPTRTDLISTAPGGDAYNGGITAYGANRGIIVFAIHEGGGSGLWYRNNHTGNIDDLAFTTNGALQGIATSARANFVAFTAAQAISPLNKNTHSTVFFKHLVDGESY